MARSVNEVLEMAKNDGELMISGGASIYKQFLPLADKLYLTYINQDFEGDIYFPEFEASDWKEVSREDYEPNEKNKYSYSFVVLERKKSI